VCLGKPGAAFTQTFVLFSETNTLPFVSHHVVSRRLGFVLISPAVLLNEIRVIRPQHSGDIPAIFRAIQGKVVSGRKLAVTFENERDPRRRSRAYLGERVVFRFAQILIFILDKMLCASAFRLGTCLAPGNL